jgi:hypothetical protein
MRRNVQRSSAARRILPACLGVAVAATVLAAAPAAQALSHPSIPNLSCVEDAVDSTTGYADCTAATPSGVAPYTWSWTLNSIPVKPADPGNELYFYCSKDTSTNVGVTVTDSVGTTVVYAAEVNCRTGVPR